MKPRLKVAGMLMDLGFALHEDDMKIVRGCKRKLDIIQCWSVMAEKDGRLWEIASCHTMTELARKGLILEAATNESEVYGDFLAVPKRCPIA